MSSTSKSDTGRQIFISYSHSDRNFAERLARELMSQGQEVWWDQWDIKAGDSLIQKIFEEGLARASGFVVILSKTSVSSKWVREELDAATLRRIEGLARVIPVVLEDVSIPMPLRSLKWVDMRKDFEGGVREILNAVRGISDKPPLGASPDYIRNLPEPLVGLSRAATAVGLHLLKRSDPDADFPKSFEGPELASELGFEPNVLNDAIDELVEQGLVSKFETLGTAPFDFNSVEPTYVLYIELKDHLNFDPVEDIRQVAACVASLEWADGPRIQERTGLSPGRINRAADYLADYGKANVNRAMGTAPFEFDVIQATRKTRQFVSGGNG